MRTSTPDAPADLLVVGAGAAGLATAIFAARRLPHWRILVLDGAAAIGAKILVAGGGRCNVTNRTVLPADYNGGSANVVRRVLAAFDVDQTVAFFHELGVPLHEEEFGKLFPDSNSARTVVAALLREIERLGVDLRTQHRVQRIERADAGFCVHAPAGALRARRVVLATGGLSLPKTGSDGGGYALATAFGHTIVATTPALDPLLLAGEFHAPLAGVAHDAEMTVHVAGVKPVRRRGPLLWTHFGVSGPLALDMSRHWNRAAIEHTPATCTLSFLPGEDFASTEAWLVDAARASPRMQLGTIVATRLPARVAERVLAAAGVDASIATGQLDRERRRAVVHALIERPLAVAGSRGYKYAEVTAGGVPLSEIDAGMQSRCCPGLYLVGEILDVDGRIGGFNFQWAWSGAWVLAEGLARAEAKRGADRPPAAAER